MEETRTPIHPLLPFQVPEEVPSSGEILWETLGCLEGKESTLPTKQVTFPFEVMRLGYLNDLWVTQNNGFSWKPKSGSLSANQVGIYGTVGVGSLGNTPGSRTEAAHWIDQKDNLWLFGGFGFGSNSTAGKSG